MRRREIAQTIAILASTVALPALPQPARIARVAWVSADRETAHSANFDAFRGGMRELGFVEGRNLSIQSWWGEGSGERIEKQSADIVRSKPDVIVAAGGLALFPLIRAGVKEPIVFSISADPVEAKIVDSYARPGGNVTGISLFTLSLVGKKMELLKDMLPGIRRVALLANQQHPGERKELEAAQAAASRLGLTVRYFPVRSEAELEKALAEIARAHDDAIIAFADGFMLGFADRLAAFSLQYRIPTVDGWAPFARSGNLMIYGPVIEDVYRRLASQVERILKGTKPADIPVELPLKVELVVNLKTAKALGLTIPSSVLVRADEVIQ